MNSDGLQTSADAAQLVCLPLPPIVQLESAVLF